MAKKTPSWVLPLALGLVVLGFAEDLTGALIIVGLLTSFTGVIVYYWGAMRKRKR